MCLIETKILPDNLEIYLFYHAMMTKKKYFVSEIKINRVLGTLLVFIPLSTTLQTELVPYYLHPESKARITHKFRSRISFLKILPGIRGKRRKIFPRAEFNQNPTKKKPPIVRYE